MTLAPLRSFIHNPQKLWLRKALFQVHLWVGLFVALYIALIGITGSILVFRKEIEQAGRPAALRTAWDGTASLDLSAALTSIEQTAAGKTVSFIYAPKPDMPAYIGLLRDKGGSQTVAVDPNTGAFISRESGDAHPFMRWVGQFHYFLLLPRNPGLMLNGIGSILLLVLTASGLVIWWPGIRAWKRGFIIDFARSWKRINFDSHNVVGFWTLSIVAFWAISGVYFAWPQEFMAAVTKVSPLTDSAKRVTVAPMPKGTPRVKLETILADATARSPGRTLAAASLGSPVIVYMSRTPTRNLLEADFLYYNPYTGKHLATWQRGLTNTLGDWVLWSMAPVHFGTQWGLTVKVIWGLLGLSLPLLVITGFLMYWNRYLSKKF